MSNEEESLIDWQESLIEPSSNKAKLRLQIEKALKEFDPSKITRLPPHEPRFLPIGCGETHPKIGCHPLWEEGHVVKISKMV